MKTKKIAKAVKKTLNQLTIENRQKSGRLEVFPLVSKKKSAVFYLTLKKALEHNGFSITEKDARGSVPELKVVNNLKKRVLLVAGEEISGAKQNRILNTSILVKKQSELIIPVSCTEQGRWRDTSRRFNDSDIIAHSRLRAKNISSVTHNLRESGNFHGDQGEVWSEIDHMINSEPVVHSSTSALKDYFDQKNDDISKHLKKIKWIPGQKGVVVAIDGKIKGAEYISSQKAFKELYHKILKSYAAELSQTEDKPQKSRETGKKEVAAFLRKTAKAQMETFKSPGHGYDVRFTGKKVYGTALSYRKEVIHLTAFAKDYLADNKHLQTSEEDITAEILQTLERFEKRRSERSSSDWDIRNITKKNEKKTD